MLKSRFSSSLKANYMILIELPIVTALGFISKLYKGIGHEWANNSLGGVFYVIFFILVFSLIVSKKKIWIISILVLLITSLLECLQLWKPPFLQLIRSTFIGASLLGTTFVPSDFIYYVIGAISGYILAYNLKREI